MDTQKRFITIIVDDYPYTISLEDVQGGIINFDEIKEKWFYCWDVTCDYNTAHQIYFYPTKVICSGCGKPTRNEIEVKAYREGRLAETRKNLESIFLGGNQKDLIEAIPIGNI